MASSSHEALTLEPLTIAELEDYSLYQYLEPDARAHPIVLDSHDTLRFKPDPVVHWMYERYQGDYINALWLDYHHGVISLASLARHYRDIGMSLSGYDEAIGDAYREAEDASQVAALRQD
jgi:hypothetical protein